MNKQSSIDILKAIEPVYIKSDDDIILGSENSQKHNIYVSKIIKSDSFT